MRSWSIVCLGILVTTLGVTPANAGRRARRAVRSTAVVAAAATAAPRRSTTVVAPVVVPQSRVVAATPVTAVPSRSPVYVLSPDLTVTEIATIASDALCLTIKNVGQAPSPQTTLQLDVDRAADGVRLASQSMRVRPLLVNQSLKITVRSAPLGNVKAIATVDPHNLVAESNEQNNARSVSVVAAPVAAPLAAPPELEEENVWGVPSQP